MTVSSPPHLLVTGFGHFPGVAENPTARLLQMAADWADYKSNASALTLETQILPTEYGAVSEWVERRMAQDPPDIFLMLGYSSVADRLKIETRASNMCAPDLADASGFRPLPAQRSPRYICSTLPLDAISAALMHAEIDHDMSDDCGEYVCNHIYYQVQSLARLQAYPMLSGFIHVPPIDFGEGRIVPPGTNRERPVAEILRGLSLIVETSIAA